MQDQQDKKSNETSFSLKKAYYTLIIFSKCKNRLSFENCAVFLTEPGLRAELHFKQVHSCIIKKVP